MISAQEASGLQTKPTNLQGDIIKPNYVTLLPTIATTHNRIVHLQTYISIHTHTCMCSNNFSQPVALVCFVWYTTFILYVINCVKNWCYKHTHNHFRATATSRTCIVIECINSPHIICLARELRQSHGATRTCAKRAIIVFDIMTCCSVQTNKRSQAFRVFYNSQIYYFSPACCPGRNHSLQESCSPSK